MHLFTWQPDEEDGRATGTRSPMKIERIFFFICLQEMRFRNLTVRGHHPRIQMKSIVQYKSELDSGSAHKSQIPTLGKLLYKIYS